MTKHYSSREADKFVVRLPDGMREAISQKARTNHRSMNSQVLVALEADLMSDTGEYDHELPVEPWNPVRGMLVQLRDGSGKVYGLDDFDIDDKGEVFAELRTGPDDLITKRLKDIKPFMVK